MKDAVDAAYPMSECLERMVEGQRRKSASTGAGTPLVEASPTDKDNDRLMAILPYPPDPSSTCTAPHVDGCPECAVNVEPPQHIERTAAGCAAWYLCADCGHAWTTAWGCI